MHSEQYYDTINQRNTAENPQNNSNAIYLDRFTFVRGSLVLVALFAISMNSIYGYALPHNNVECLLDNSFELTAGINAYLKDHIRVRNGLLIFSSICVDSLILIMFIHWVAYGKSWRVVIALFTFYTFRAMVQVNKYIKLVSISNEIS
jgi:hypothetical protein